MRLLRDLSPCTRWISNHAGTLLMAVNVSCYVNTGGAQWMVSITSVVPVGPKEKIVLNDPWCPSQLKQKQQWAHQGCTFALYLGLCLKESEPQGPCVQQPSSPGALLSQGDSAAYPLPPLSIEKWHWQVGYYPTSTLVTPLARLPQPLPPTPHHRSDAPGTCLTPFSLTPCSQSFAYS